MANTQHPGFYPSRATNGGAITYTRKRVITNNSAPIGLQDAVKIDTNGNVLGLGTSSTQSAAIQSVAMGVSYVDSTLGRISAKNLPASTLYTSSGIDPDNATYVFLVENPVNVIFRASVDEAIVLADLYSNMEIVLGTPSNGQSIQELDASTKANTATLPIRVVDFVFQSDNDVDSADAHVFCMVNAGQIEPALTTTGLA